MTFIIYIVYILLFSIIGSILLKLWFAIFTFGLSPPIETILLLAIPIGTIVIIYLIISKFRTDYYHKNSYLSERYDGVLDNISFRYPKGWDTSFMQITPTKRSLIGLIFISISNTMDTIWSASHYSGGDSSKVELLTFYRKWFDKKGKTDEIHFLKGKLDRLAGFSLVLYWKLEERQTMPAPKLTPFIINQDEIIIDGQKGYVYTFCRRGKYRKEYYVPYSYNLNVGFP